MTHIHPPTLLWLALAALSACAADDTSTRGELVDVTSLGDLEVAQIEPYLASFGLDASRARLPVSLYQIVYRTIAPDGEPTTASGLVALPRGGDDELRVVSWLHGTTVFRGEVASMTADSSDRATAVMFASAGFAVSAPDFLGLGIGPGFHPYDHVASETTASLDALRATRELAHHRDRDLDPRVLVTGFSQGGRSTMALGRALDRGDDPSFEVGGLAPIGGPYHMSATFATAVSGDIAFATAYMSYLMIAWNRVHHLYASPSDVFQEPFDQTLEGLFDGNHRAQEIFDGLPEVLEDLFTPVFLAEMRAPSGVLAAVLREEDTTCDWRPAVAVQIYAATGDRDVPIANATYCRDALVAHGGAAEVIDVGDLDHSESVNASLPRVLARFAASP